MREARRYEELATYARSAGFLGVSAAAVQHWVKRGLLPRAEPRPYRFGRRGLSYSARTGQQLLALCRLHYDMKVRDLEAVALDLWFQGFDLPPSTTRGALFRAVDVSRAAEMGRVLTVRRGDGPGSRLDDVGTFADAVITPHRSALGGIRTAEDAADLTQGVTDHVARSLHLGDGPPDPAGIDALGRAAGLTVVGAAQLPAVARLWDPDVARAAIESASPRQLAAARAGAILATAQLETMPEAPTALTLSKASQLRALFAASFLVLRDYQLARDVLSANDVDIRDANAGSTALEYL